MRALIIGGSGSGKSRYAEDLACNLAGNGPLLYLATMSAGDGESRERIRRHRAQRAGRGFQTVERPRDLAGLEVPAGAVVLLEDLGNLAANELFSESVNRENALQRIETGITHLERTCRHLVVVGNALFSDGADYDRDTMDYLRIVAEVQNHLAARFDQMTELVCAMPVFWKGENR